jgi:hypothetical protein
MVRRVTLLFWLTGVTLCAQSLVEERRLGRVLPMMTDSAKQTLRCSISPIAPQLNYSFRFQAGYVVNIPMQQFEGAGHYWRMVTRITAVSPGASPAYLASFFRLPAVPPTKVELQVGGGYLLGEGVYDVRHLFMDDKGRGCRRDWRVEVRRKRGEDKVRVAMQPNTVLDLALSGRSAPPPTDADMRPLRLTILLHAAPTSPRRSRLRTGDILTLLASVTSVLEQVPVSNVRLVSFNLDQQRELYRKDGFQLSDLPSLADSMTNIELGLVDVKVLQNRRGHVETIAALANSEVRADPPSDAVVFLGPNSRFSDKMPQEALDRQTSQPQFLFFQLAPLTGIGYPGRGVRGLGGAPGPGLGAGRGFPTGGVAMPESSFPDSIRYAVSRLGGKTITIRTPGDLAKAIGRLEQTRRSRDGG